MQFSAGLCFLLLAAAAVPLSSASALRAEKKLRPYKTHHSAKHEAAKAEEKAELPKHVSPLVLKAELPKQKRFIANDAIKLPPASTVALNTDAGLAPPLPPPPPQVKAAVKAPRHSSRHSDERQAPLAQPEVQSEAQPEVESQSVAQPASTSSVAVHFNQKLSEVKQRRANVVQMQQALSAEVALLRESTALQKASESQHSRDEAINQIKKTEQLVKDTTGMLRESRSEAVEDAKNVLQEVQDTQSALNALRTEATEALQTLAPAKSDTVSAPPAPLTVTAAPVQRSTARVAAATDAAADDVDDLDDTSEQ